jgi:beta-glucosidase
MTLDFPPGFLFGVATSAYQIEGAVAEDGRAPSIWDTFCRLPGRVHRGDTGEIACDHYHRVDADLDLLAALGVGAYRFSIAWPRVMPDGVGPLNPKGIAFYRRVLEGLHRRGVVPMVTLYHWDLPETLQNQGGWTSRETCRRFADYVAAVAGELGDLVPYWITLNEPWCSSFLGHLEGRHAPGDTDLTAALRAAHHLMLAHGYATEALRSAPGGGRIGISLNLSDLVPATERAEDCEAARRVDGNENRWFLEPLLFRRYPDDMLTWYRDRSDLSFVCDGDLDKIAQPLDFLGINYYEHRRIAEDPAEPIHHARQLRAEGPTTDGGTAIEPAGLTRILRRIRDEYGPLPIFVTESGAHFADYLNPEGTVEDVERIDYLKAHLGAAAEAIVEGVDLRGYFIWSLLDNFEWASGYGPRFGLVYVDFATQRRVPKRSALWYRDFIASCTRVTEARRAAPGGIATGASASETAVPREVIQVGHEIREM